MSTSSAPPSASTLILIGMPGAGKTTVGRLLAARTGRRHVDADVELVKRNGVSIATMFELEGETRFRDREEELLGELAQERELVLSTGGGAVVRPINRSTLRANGTVFYLHADPTVLLARVQQATGVRPLLNAPNPLARLQALYATRDAWYRETAHHVLGVGSGAPSKVVRDICACLGSLLG